MMYVSLGCHRPAMTSKVHISVTLELFDNVRIALECLQDLRLGNGAACLPTTNLTCGHPWNPGRVGLKDRY